LNDYINNVILDLEDIDNNGKYDINDFLKIENNEILDMNNGKKFDVVLMNPPYDKNLHLKFLEKTIEIADNVVSVQPIRWLQDPLVEYKKTSAYKKYEKTIARHIVDLDVFSADEATQLFGADFIIKVGIYTCDNNNHNYYETIKFNKDGVNFSFIQKITDKIKAENNFKKLNIKRFSDDLTNFVPLNNMTGENIQRCKPTNCIKEWTKPYKTGIEYRIDKSKKKGVARGKIENDLCIVFDTYEEAKNCFDAFTKCNFTRFYMSIVTTDIHIYHELQPFMSDYSKPWTDERFYKYFNITKEEQKIIEEYADKIWKRINK